MNTTRHQFWTAPTAHGPVNATVTIPGSKSITNRALILAALANGPSTLTGTLRSRDTNLMIEALRLMGTDIREEAGNSASEATTLHIHPHPLTGARVDVGLAGTVMRFLPPVAALASGTVFFDGDPQARKRPISTTLSSLRDLGVHIDGEGLPFSVTGAFSTTDQAATPNTLGGTVELDASSSSQFVSGLLLSAARFGRGLTIRHIGAPIPSQPHIDMTVHMLRLAGVQVDTSTQNQWIVEPGPISGRTWAIEPDLSNATPFLAAAVATGGEVTIPHWPQETTQPGAQFAHIAELMGAECEFQADWDGNGTPALTVRGGQTISGISLDMHDIGELTPTVAALAALATSPSHLAGIAHLRGHETDRLAALATEINALGGSVKETADGLIIEPATLHAGQWHSYADHRMATAGAIIGLTVPGIEVENIETTSKTLPGFTHLWREMLEG